MYVYIYIYIYIYIYVYVYIYIYIIFPIFLFSICEFTRDKEISVRDPGGR